MLPNGIKIYFGNKGIIFLYFLRGYLQKCPTIKRNSYDKTILKNFEVKVRSLRRQNV